MIGRFLVTAVLLLFAVGGFFGASPATAGPLNPFGLFFLCLGVLVWCKWGMISGAYAVALSDGTGGRASDPFRAFDDHYRRDGRRHYCEPEQHTESERGALLGP